MELARQVASLGLSARNAAGIKVRQPLSRVLVFTRGARELSAELVEIVTDELNVKALEFVQDPKALVEYRLMPDNKKLGPRFGAQFPKVRQALAQADAAAVAERVQAGEAVELSVDGQAYRLEPDEILVTTEPAEGLAVAADRLTTVAVDAEITPELRAEGLAREVVRRIQAMRKDAGFDISDRITTGYQVEDGDLAQVFESWGDYIREETLTVELLHGRLPEGAYTETHNVEGQQLTLGVKKTA